MKKELRKAYDKANINPRADVYVSSAFWDAAQRRRKSLSSLYGLELTEEMAMIYTLADFEKRQIAYRMSEPYGPIIVFVPGTYKGNRLKGIFRELVSVKRGELSAVAKKGELS